MIGKKYNLKKIAYLLILVILGLLFFLGIGTSGAVEFADSEGYMAENIRSGVMPVYHLFLRSLRLTFGAEYLKWAVLFQGLFACVTTIVFSYYICDRFDLKDWEVLIIWVLTLLPFATELPEYVATHVIYTESLCYAMYYYFVMIAFEVICAKKGVIVKGLGLWLMALLLASTRSQLLLLFGIVGFVFAYKIIVTKGKWYYWIVSLAMIGVVCLLGIVSTYRIRGLYQTALYSAEVSVAGESVEYAMLDENGNKDALVSASTDEDMAQGMVADFEDESGFDVSNDKNTEQTGIEQNYEQEGNNDQLALALLCRGFFEADEEDVRFYEEGLEQVAFRNLYKLCNEAGILHNSVGHGLWAWYDYTKTDIYVYSNQAIIEAYQETDAYGHRSDAVTRDIVNLKMKLGYMEILHHPIRFAYRTFRLMIPGFISCIFFNIRKIYIACHILVAFLYITAVIMANNCKYSRNKSDEKISRFIMFNLFCCVVFVGSTNLVFYGMQRYFLYLMGVFYVGYYLGVRQWMGTKINFKR